MARALAVIALLILAALLQWAVYYPMLPDTLASHFDGAGHPNGWTSKAAFFQLMAAVLGIDVLFLVGLAPLLQRLPTSLVNLPHRDYWLAPERRARSLETVGVRLVWFAAASFLLALVIVQDVIAANLSESPRLGPLTPAALVVYLAFTVIWLVALFGRFPKPPG